MSQAGVLSVNTSGAPVVETLSGENGPQTPPDGHNFNFSGSIAGGSTTNGAILFSTVNPGEVNANVQVDGTTIDINGSNQLHVIPNVFGETITGDTGGPLPPTAGNWNILTQTFPTLNSWAFQGSGSTLSLNSTANVVTLNLFTGNLCGNTSTTGIRNCGYGTSTLQNLAGGSTNLGFGFNTLSSLTSGSTNEGWGSSVFPLLLTGIYNLGLGYGSGSAYTGAESSNVLVKNVGVIGDSHVIRIGTQGSSDQQQNTCYIAGITGVTVSNQQIVTINSSTGQLGVTGATSVIAYTNVNFAASPYTVLATDQYISCDTSGGAITLNFPNAPTAKQSWIVKDRTGNAGANNITITTPGGAVTIDGGVTFLLNTAYAAVNLLANSTPTYEVY